jgi:iron(III) transport system substrate-binding protein
MKITTQIKNYTLLHSVAGAIAIAALSASGVVAQEATLGIPDKGYSLEALIAAAKQEGPITVVDATGKIVTMAENFAEKYGIETTGVKLSGQDQEQILAREAAANNVQHDVFNMSNLPSVTSDILPQGYGISWFPPDLAAETPENYQNPAITSLNPWVWSYNTEVYGEDCPVDNMWALTDAEWQGKISIPDPLLRNETMFWFNQIETNNDDDMRAAYEAHFGEPLDTDEASATAEWVKRLAANKPNVTRSDSDVGPIVGARGQTEPHMGFVSAAIFRDAAQNDYAMGMCTGMKPWIGQLTPRVAVIASGTKSPNAAKLFVHYMMSAEGMGPQLIDGKLSTNINAEMPADEASGIASFLDQLHVTRSETTAGDFDRLQDWQDFWTISSR